MSTTVLDERSSPSQGSQHPYGSYIGGEWVDTKEYLDVVDPSSGKAFAKVSSIQQAHVAAALATAERAFVEWRQVSALERGNLLRKVADELMRRRPEIARTITLENGKPLAQSEGEVAMSADHLYWFAEEARRVRQQLCVRTQRLRDDSRSQPHVPAWRKAGSRHTRHQRRRPYRKLLSLRRSQAKRMGPGTRNRGA